LIIIVNLSSNPADTWRIVPVGNSVLSPSDAIAKPSPESVHPLVTDPAEVHPLLVDMVIIFDDEGFTVLVFLFEHLLLPSLQKPNCFSMKMKSIS
jgi:hypothetical protein